MARLLELDRWLIDAAVPRGFRVVVVDGFAKRGYDPFGPGGAVAHHTAGRCPRGSYQIVVNGRSGLPGPLCNVYIDCEGTIYVVAAGRANHAGAGGYRGLTGNSSVFGIEPEHIGSASTPWPAKQMAAYILVMAVVMQKLGRDGSWVAAHREWAPSRKSDPAGIDMHKFRAQVTAMQRELAAGPAHVPPTPTFVSEDDMFMFWHRDAVYLAQGGYRSGIGIHGYDVDALKAKGVPVLGKKGEHSMFFDMMAPFPPKPA